MIKYLRHTLSNGLKISAHQDRSSQLSSVHVVYKAGSKYDPKGYSGMAHLFEHLMFSGSENVADFDDPQQMAGGENNAYTNADIAHYYQVLPSAHLDTALWLESDRMFSLKLNEAKLKTQKKVIAEEFNETVVNQPFGDIWHHLYPMVYRSHPYMWPTMGKNVDEIQKVNLEEAMDFYARHYRPERAVLSIAGPEDPEVMVQKAIDWFDRPNHPSEFSLSWYELPEENPQNGLRYKEIDNKGERLKGIFMAFPMPGRLDSGYYPCDLISDILGHGNSALLIQELVEEAEIFSYVDAYINGNEDCGLLIIEGRPAEGVPTDNALNAIWEILEVLRQEGIGGKELNKWKNKVETTLLLGDLGIHSKAGNLAYFDHLGRIDRINEELENYLEVSTADIKEWAGRILDPTNANVLVYTT